MGTPRSDDGGRSARRGESAAGADCQASMGSSPVPWVEVGRVGPGGELVEGLPLGTSVVYTRPAGQVGFCGLRNSRGRGDGSWERLGDAGRRAGESRGGATRLSFPPVNAARRPGNPRAASCAAGLPLSAWLGFVRGCCLSWPPRPPVPFASPQPAGGLHAPVPRGHVFEGQTCWAGRSGFPEFHKPSLSPEAGVRPHLLSAKQFP